MVRWIVGIRKLETIMKHSLDEFQEDEMSFGDMCSPYREVNKRVSSDLRDEPVASSLFVTTIDTLRSSLMQILSRSIFNRINNLQNQLSIKAQDISSKKSCVINDSQCIIRHRESFGFNNHYRSY